MELRFLHVLPFHTDYFITCAPQELRTIYLRPKETIPFLGNCRFHALRELHIIPCGSPQAYSFILTQCPSLETLEILSYFVDHSHTQTMAVHPLHRLHTFIVNECDGDWVWLLNSFDTPSLRSLDISIWQHRGESFTRNGNLSNFLMRCGSLLQHLKLAGGIVTHDDLYYFLRYTPILESLSVDSNSLTGDLTALCPPIVHFDILVTFSHADQTLIAVDAIISRWKENRLKDCGDTISPCIIRVPSDTLSVVLRHPGVKECIRQGLRVVHLPHKTECWWLDP